MFISRLVFKIFRLKKAVRHLGEDMLCYVKRGVTLIFYLEGKRSIWPPARGSKTSFLVAVGNLEMIENISNNFGSVIQLE